MLTPTLILSLFIFGKISAVSGWMIQDVFCDNQMKKHLELAPKRGTENTDKTTQEFGCKLMASLFAIDTSKVVKLTLSTEWFDGTDKVLKSFQSDELKDGKIDLSQVSMKFPPKCGCLTTKFMLMADGEKVDELVKKLEIICPKDGSISLEPSPTTSVQSITTDELVNDVKVTIVRKGPSLWERVGHQAISLVVGIKCNMKLNSKEWKAIGNNARLGFADIPLHKSNLIDGMIIKEGNNEVDLSGKLELESCIQCQNATLVISLDPTQMINEIEVLEAGWALPVEVSCFNQDKEASCDAYPSYEDEDEAWVTFMRPKTPRIMSKPQTEIYKINKQKKITKGFWPISKKDAAMVMGIGISEQRNCYYPGPMIERALDLFTELHEKVTKRKDNGTEQMQMFEMAVEGAFVVAKHMINEGAEPIAQCLTELQLRLSAVTKMLGKMLKSTMGGDDNDQKVDEKNYEPIRFKRQSLDEFNMEKPAGDQLPTKPENLPEVGSEDKIRSMNEGTKPAYGTTRPPVYAYSDKPAYGTTRSPVYGYSDKPAYGTTRSPMYGYSDKPAYGTTRSPMYGYSDKPAYGTTRSPMYGYSHKPAYGTTRSPMHDYSIKDIMNGMNPDNEQSGGDGKELRLPETCKEVAKLAIDLLRRGSNMRSELVEKLHKTFATLKDLRKDLFQVPESLPTLLAEEFRSYPQQLMFCKKSTFAEAIPKLSKILDKIEGSTEAEKATLNIFRFLISFALDDVDIHQELVTLMSDVCNFMTTNEYPVGDMCKEHKEGTCTTPWLKHEGTIYAGAYSPILGQDCYYPVFMCECGKCSAKSDMDKHMDYKMP